MQLLHLLAQACLGQELRILARLVDQLASLARQLLDKLRHNRFDLLQIYLVTNYFFFQVYFSIVYMYVCYLLSVIVRVRQTVIGPEA